MRGHWRFQIGGLRISIPYWYFKKKPKYEPSEPHLTAEELLQLEFPCQLAQGSPICVISGFSNIEELYEKIAACYGFPSEDILFCTLNTHKVDMENILTTEIGLQDFIFVHTKGRTKEIEIVKDVDALGLTLTDNGVGYVMIKKIKEGSTVADKEDIDVGDHIEKVNGRNMVGKKHYQVAKVLQDYPKGSTITLRLVEPLKGGLESMRPITTEAKFETNLSYNSREDIPLSEANREGIIENNVGAMARDPGHSRWLEVKPDDDQDDLKPIDYFNKSVSWQLPGLIV